MKTFTARCQNPDCTWTKTADKERDADLLAAEHELMAPDDDFIELHPTTVEEAA